MFLFVQAKENLKLIDQKGYIPLLESSCGQFIHFQNECSVLISDFPFEAREKDIRIWFQGELHRLPNKIVREALEEKTWERFGTRFTYNKYNGEWTIDVDPIGAFSFYNLFHEQGVLVSDRLDSLIAFKLVDCRENPDWVADILISGFPHDNTCIIKPFERVPASSHLMGRGGKVLKRFESSFMAQIDEPLSSPEVVRQSSEALGKICSEYPTDDLGLQLTGGYDSRLLLATLLRLGIKPKTYTFGAGNNYNGQIAQKLANELGLDHIFIELGKSYEAVFSNSYNQTLLATDGLASPSHTHYAFASPAISGSISSAVSGVAGGELHRGFLEQNVTLPWLLFGLFSDKSNRLTPLWFQNVINSFGADLKKVLNNRITALYEKWQKQNRADVLLRNVFGGFFQSLIRIENVHLPVVYPFLDPRFLKVILRSPYGILYGKNIHADSLFKLMSQCNLVQAYKSSDSILLKAKTDKGFPPDFLLNRCLWLLIPMLVYLSRKKRKYPKELKYNQWLLSFLLNNEDTFMKNASEFSQVLKRIKKSGIQKESEKFILSRISHIATARKILFSKYRK